MMPRGVGNTGSIVRLVDMIFPGDTNHHGTLFGGVALAHIDKVAFLAASRHGRAPFVTASCERIYFAAPALKGELIEATGELTVGIDVTGYPRIMDAAHRSTPTGTGYGKTRFASPANALKLLYVAQNLPSAVIRARYQGKQKREPLEEDIDQSVIASMVARDPLKLLDLRPTGTSRLGGSTDAARGRAQQSGRRFSQELNDSTDLDGIVYMSRITNAEASRFTIVRWS